jgi:hypothetical protein
MEVDGTDDCEDDTTVADADEEESDVVVEGQGWC